MSCRCHRTPLPPFTLFTLFSISSYDNSSIQTPYPIKDIYFKTARVRDKVKTIIFLGGSQGAKAINELALNLAPILKQQDISIIHQAGEKNIQEVKQAYKDMGIKAEVFGFSTKLPEYIAQADFAIARSGASTLWELSANALPALYIPYPYVASDHQYYNAKFLVDQNLAYLQREKDIDIKKIEAIIMQNMSDISTKLQQVIQEDGANSIADRLKSLHNIMD